MSRISRFLLLARYQGSPTQHVVHLRRGRTIHSGVGQGFWFLPSSAAISEVPTVDFERPVLFHAITKDRQDVTVQVVLTYRFADPEQAATRLDFAIHPRLGGDGKEGAGAMQGLRQVADLVSQIAQSLTADVLGSLDLDQALDKGLALVRQTLEEGFVGHSRLEGMGVQVSDLRVISLRPENEIEKALQTPLRERLQAEADRALYERRAVAVERERQISENELTSKLELARRREDLVAQEGVNARREAEEKAQAALIDSTGKAERLRLEAGARAEEVQQVGLAEAQNERIRIEAYSALGPGFMWALALRDAAKHLPDIGELNVTPDVLSKLLNGLAKGSALNSVILGSGTTTASTADTPPEGQR